MSFQQIDPVHIKFFDDPRRRPQPPSPVDQYMRARGFLKIGECRSGEFDYSTSTPENHK